MRKVAISVAWAVMASLPRIALAADELNEEGSDEAVIVGIGVALMIFLIVRALLPTGGRGKRGASSGGGESTSSMRRRAKKLRAEGHAQAAGQLFMEAGDSQAALETLLQAGLVGKAGPIFEEQGDLQAALEAYEAGRDHEGAARIAVRVGDQVRAATNYEKGGNLERAAKHWSMAGDAARSGKAWWDLGEHLKAAETFQKAQLWEEAGKAYLHLVRSADSEDHDISMGMETEKPPELKDLTLRAGRTLVKAGNQGAAAEAFLKGGHDGEAASALEASGQFEKAARIWAEAGDGERAANLLERAGHADQAASIRARAALKAGKVPEAAAWLEKAGELANAAELWGRLGDHARAADLYEKVSEWYAAGQAWERAGDPSRAAAVYERGGDRRRSAELYKASGDSTAELRLRSANSEWVRAAQLLVTKGQLAEAEETLKRVGEGDTAWREASKLLGDLYRKQGQIPAAVVKYRQAIEGLKADAGSAEVFYLLGRCALDGGDAALAKQAFARLREHDPTYKDVQDRYVEAHRRTLAPKEGPKADRASARTASDIPAPAPKSRYTRLDKLGRGGMGTVFRAMDKVLQREVALKVLNHADTDEAKARRLFLREARAAAVLNHPNIVTVFDFGEEDDDLFIAMELVEGTTLRALVQQAEPLGVPLITTVLRQACEALSYAHANHVIHRDIKPANLMWTRGTTLKIADFGLAKILEGSGPSKMSQVLGTPYYMSPEQIRGDLVDHRTDIYSLGITLFELATAMVPFARGNVLQQHLEAQPPRPREYREGLPAWMEEIILRCLQKAPDDRFSAVEAIAKAIPA
jgi:tetratricopeptide (TPR) repeat protein